MSWREYFRRLTDAFGKRYVAAVLLTYGVNQGLGEALLEAATNNFLLDVLHFDVATTEQVTGFARIPWQLKSLFGLLSDLLPIEGYHRAPYMLIAGCLGVFGNLVLTVLPMATPPWGAGLLLMLTNVNFAMVRTQDSNPRPLPRTPLALPLKGVRHLLCL